MIESAMYVALGFLVASLIALLMSRPLWRRAVRLTTLRLESTLPMSRADMEADRDELRAQYAIKLRNFELALEKEKAKSTRYLVDRNKSRAVAQELNRQLTELKAQLAERDNQIRVLEQHVRHGRRAEDLVGKAVEGEASEGAHAREMTMAELTARADAGRSETRPSGGHEPLQDENERLKRELEALRTELATLRGTAARDWDLLKTQVTELAEKILQGEARAAPKSSIVTSRASLASTAVPKPKAPASEAGTESKATEKPAAAISGTGLRSRLGTLAQRLESLTESDRK